jgi:hypothetical protein
MEEGEGPEMAHVSSSSETSEFHSRFVETQSVLGTIHEEMKKSSIPSAYSMDPNFKHEARNLHVLAQMLIEKWRKIRPKIQEKTLMAKEKEREEKLKTTTERKRVIPQDVRRNGETRVNLQKMPNATEVSTKCLLEADAEYIALTPSRATKRKRLSPEERTESAKRKYVFFSYICKYIDVP